MPQTPFYANMVCELWDLVDGGIDDVLLRVKGEAGVNGITLTLAGGPVDRFRPQVGVTPRMFRSTAGAHFHPNADRYEATRLKPVAADWLRSRDPLPRVYEACDRQGIRLRGRLTLGPALGQLHRHDESKLKNAYGEINPAWYCPVNPDVRALYTAMVADVCDRQVCNKLEIMLRFPHASWTTGEAPAGFAGTNAAAWLLGLCFCESCRQQAGNDDVNIDAASHAARVLIDAVRQPDETDPGMSLADLLGSDDALRQLHVWRQAQITTLAAELIETASCDIWFARSNTPINDNMDNRVIADLAAGLIARCPCADRVEDIDAVVRRVCEETNDVRRTELRIDLHGDQCDEGDILVRCAQRAAGHGVAHMTFGDFGLLTTDRLDWVRRAVRFASREMTS